MFESAWQDVRYGARLLRRSPLFTFTAALSLAIGIGANTTIFSVASALLLRPLPGVAEPDRLVDIGRTQNGRDFDTSSYPNYRDIRARQTSLTDVYAIRLEPQPMGLGGEGGAERVHGTVVSGNYFAVLGTQPAAGRLIAPADEEGAPGSHPVMVIAHGLWQRRFGGDAAVVGQTVLLNGHPFVIAGVAPQGFQGTTVLQSEVWVPIAAMHLATPRRDASMLRSRLASWLVLGGRLKAGVTVGQADAELQLIGAALEREFPDVNHGRGLKDRLPRAGVRGRGLTGRGARIRARPRAAGRAARRRRGAEDRRRRHRGRTAASAQRVPRRAGRAVAAARPHRRAVPARARARDGDRSRLRPVARRRRDARPLAGAVHRRVRTVVRARSPGAGGRAPWRSLGGARRRPAARRHQHGVRRGADAGVPARRPRDGRRRLERRVARLLPHGWTAARPRT